MGTLIMIAQLLLAISLIVGLHELGHLLTAKLFGMRVEKYSIGFPPKIFGLKWGETEYAVGAIPLGGYVKISGMIDESMDKDFLQNEPLPHEFRSKPAWQRLIVMVGGVTVNVITGVMMFIGLAYVFGESYLPVEEANKYGIVAYKLGKEIGLKDGDKIIKINGQKIERFEEAVRSPKLLLESNSNLTVLREGKEVLIKIPNDFVEKLSLKRDKPSFLDVRTPFKVDEVMRKSPAAKAGIQKGDQIIEVNNKPIQFYHEFEMARDQFVEKNFPKNNNKPGCSFQKPSDRTVKIDVVVLRNGEKKDLRVELKEEGKFGFFPSTELKRKHTYFSFGESIIKGTDNAFGSVSNNIKGFGKIIRGEVSTKSLSGPIGIAKIFGTNWDWAQFWFITGVLSMWLAFLNLLPIPALDGGHVMFLSYEIISGRKPSDKFLENAQKVGMVILLALMVFVLFNDIVNMFN